MIDTKLLRQKILDLAIRGKLVPQNPNDEPASVLLQKIREEKAALVKAGKIKKDKHESIIFRGEDKRYYEKIDGKTTDITEQIPFEIPNGWEWCRLRELGIFSGGKTPSMNNPNFWNGDVLWVTSKDMKCKYINDTGLKVSDVGADELELLPIDTLLMVTRSGILRHTFPIAICERPCTINQDLKSLSLYLPPTAEYVFNVLKASEGRILSNYKKTGTTVESIMWDQFVDIMIPISPLAEQTRLVVQIDSLLADVDKIDADSVIFEDFLSLSKQKVLDLAIRGKLVPQDPSDEPASELLKKIKDEKEALIKAGKIKRDKRESFVFRGDDNRYYEDDGKNKIDVTTLLPFEIPKSWVWCRFNAIGELNPRNKADDNTLSSFVAMAHLFGGYGSAFETTTKVWKEIKQGFTHFAENDVVFAKITPCFQNRKSAIMKNLKNGIGAGTTELHVMRCNSSLINLKYVLFFVKTQKFINDGLSTTLGVVGQQRIDSTFVGNYFFPLPPRTEQKRIVSQIELVFAQLETMRE